MSAFTKRTPSSLTPQRKHRKLLKDGSGIEVWPESIEKIFVQGLREYWSSPWATYSQSRGRSRWRNQFLVDYLQKAGIDRSKKQVASHIQVLRNMWKGEPEFYLVAGGEEPLPETPVKLEDSSLISLDFDETDSSSNSTSSDFSPPELQHDFPPSPGGYALGSQSPPSKNSVSPYASPALYTTSVPTAMSIYPPDMAIQHHPQDRLHIQDVYYSLNDSHRSDQAYAHPFKPTTSHAVPVGVSDIGAYSYPQSPSRATSMCLWSDGMAPLSIKLDELMSPHSPGRMPLALQLRMSITSDDGIRGTLSQDGFFAAVSFSRLWTSCGKCITRVYTNNMCTSEVVGALDVSNIQMGIVNAMLPESSLTRCRWLDATIPTRITQEIIADEETVLYLVYELDRSMGPMPSAKVMRWMTLTKSSPTVPPAHLPLTSPAYAAPLFSASPRLTSPSLSSALSPNTRNIASTSLSF
ncbi:Regulatory protein abaA [Termitomyces sp. T112]|nr:Regulatory protein abaA [Termitomyces sp. T112]KAH0583913.1 hypothetical protein H2248_009505 [Termitomyces sp. 'cryptogamus']KNZ74237.1 Regulatory protein abaA [Termitomyces sp. J132]